MTRVTFALPGPLIHDSYQLMQNFMLACTAYRPLRQTPCVGDIKLKQRAIYRCQNDNEQKANGQNKAGSSERLYERNDHEIRPKAPAGCYKSQESAACRRKEAQHSCNVARPAGDGAMSPIVSVWRSQSLDGVQQ